MEIAAEILRQKTGAGGNVRRPGEAVALHQLPAVEPRVAPENLVGALPGQGHFVVFCHKRAEVEQRCVHIGHARHILGIYGSTEHIRKGALVAFQISVVGVTVCEHDVDVGEVALRLKGVGLKIYVVFRKVKGEGV